MIYDVCLSGSLTLRSVIISSCIRVAASGIVSFLFMSGNIPLYIRTTSSLSVYLVVYIQVASRSLFDRYL